MTFYVGIVHVVGREICQSVNQFGEGVWTIELAPHFSLCSFKNLLRQPIYHWKALVKTIPIRYFWSVLGWYFSILPIPIPENISVGTFGITYIQKVRNFQ